jgi:hypothetical protein
MTRVVAIVTFLTLVIHGRATAQTTVAVTFQGAAGEPVPITSAQLMVTAWGTSERHDLPFAGNVVRLDLDATRPDFAAHITDTRGVVYVKADGYAPILSQAFAWPDKNSAAVINFRNSQLVLVGKGTTAKLSVTMRRPIARRIRLVDESGHAVAGIKLEAGAYWRSPNHCGFLAGRDVLVSGETNAEGTLDVPDVDGASAFQLQARLTKFSEHGNDGWPGMDLVRVLTSAETTLQVHTYRRQPLSLEILNNGKPVPGAVLWSDMALGVCGAGSGTLATADPRGRIQVDGFYPEFWVRYGICADHKPVWVTVKDGQRLPRKIDVAVTPSGKLDHLASFCAQ